MPSLPSTSRACSASVSAPSTSGSGSAAQCPNRPGCVVRRPAPNSLTVRVRVRAAVSSPKWVPREEIDSSAVADGRPIHQMQVLVHTPRRPGRHAVGMGVAGGLGRDIIVGDEMGVHIDQRHAHPGVTPTSTPAHQIRSMARVAAMSASGSALIRTRSAHMPTAMTPRSRRPKCRAGNAVADRSAAAGESPASTSRASSWCRLSPWRTRDRQEGRGEGVGTGQDGHPGRVQGGHAVAAVGVVVPRRGEATDHRLHHGQGRHGDLAVLEHLRDRFVVDDAVAGDVGNRARGVGRSEGVGDVEHRQGGDAAPGAAGRGQAVQS